MRRAKVTYRPEALDDLKSIYRVVVSASQNHAVASGFVGRITARCRKIGDAPNGGRQRDDLQLGLRTVSFERAAVIAYRVVDGSVEITNIFYGGRDYETLYRDSER